MTKPKNRSSSCELLTQLLHTDSVRSQTSEKHGSARSAQGGQGGPLRTDARRPWTSSARCTSLTRPGAMQASRLALKSRHSSAARIISLPQAASEWNLLLRRHAVEIEARKGLRVAKHLRVEERSEALRTSQLQTRIAAELRQSAAVCPAVVRRPGVSVQYTRARVADGLRRARGHLSWLSVLVQHDERALAMIPSPPFWPAC